MNEMRNKLPAPTWNWLKMNSVEVSVPDDVYKQTNEILTEKGEKKVVIQHYDEKDTEQTHYEVNSHVQIAEDAEVTFVQVVTPGEKVLLNKVETEIAERGHFRLIQMFLGGKETYSECVTKLSGKRAKLDLDLAYLLDKNEKLDLNLVADHTGRKTESEINVQGVLDGEAKKLFRGTIDFHRGCGGAKGTELEEVLLLSDSIVNQTIPLILCDEEDVEGNHGASIGKLGEDLLFYLKSRGMEDEAVYRMMSRAKMDSVTAKIPDEMTREMIRRRLSACHTA